MARAGEENRPNSAIHIGKETVTKIYECDAELEYEKAMALWAISKNYNFNFPKPLKLDEQKNAIEYEFIQTECSVRSFYLQFMKSAEKDEGVIKIFEECGRILGIIHKELTLSEKHIWHPPINYLEAMDKMKSKNLCEIIEEVPCAFLHCDYGFENIEYIGNERYWSLALFDASPNYFATFQANTFGPVYIDLGNFLSALEGLVPIKNYLNMKWERIDDLRNAFLEGYQHSSGIVYNKEIANIFSYATASSYLARKYKCNTLRKLGLMLLYNKWKGNQIK